MARSPPDRAVRHRAWSRAARPRSRYPGGRPEDAGRRFLDAPARLRPWRGN